MEEEVARMMEEDENGSGIMKRPSIGKRDR